MRMKKSLITASFVLLLASGNLQAQHDQGHHKIKHRRPHAEKVKEHKEKAKHKDHKDHSDKHIKSKDKRREKDDQ